MYTTKYFKDKFSAIPINEFSRGGVDPGEKPCALGHCGVNTSGSGFYHMTEEARALVDLFNQYLYPILEKKRLTFVTTLLAQGIIVFAINDGILAGSDKEVLNALGITHKTAKGRILQALDKIERIQRAEMILTEAVEAVDAEFEIID